MLNFYYFFINKYTSIAEIMISLSSSYILQSEILSDLSFLHLFIKDANSIVL